MNREYLLAIVPLEPALSLLEEMRTGSKHSTPPHITLYPPFTLEDVSEGKCIDVLTEALKTQPFTVVLDAIDSFPPANRVTYAALSESSKENLRLLFSSVQQALNGSVKDVYHGYPKSADAFVPHVTLGRSISSVRRAKLEEKFNTVTFAVDTVTLFGKQEDEYRWEKIADIPLGGL